MHEQDLFKPEEDQHDDQPDRRRIHYTPEFKLKLMQLCVQNGDQYMETVPEEDVWSYIQTLFMSITECNTGNGNTICCKVADMVGERKSEIVI